MGKCGQKWANVGKCGWYFGSTLEYSPSKAQASPISAHLDQYYLWLHYGYFRWKYFICHSKFWNEQKSHLNKIDLISFQIKSFVEYLQTFLSWNWIQTFHNFSQYSRNLGLSQVPCLLQSVKFFKVYIKFE